MSVGGSDSVGAMPFYATGGTTPQATTMKVVINAPAAGLPIHLKVENALNNGQSCETTATTTSAGWQTLTFDFSKPGLPNGDPTAALNPAFTYDKISIFPDFLNSPSAPLTFYLGPITFIGVSAPLAPPLAVVVPPTLGAPSSGAAAPTLAATSVISLLNSSGTYTNISIGDWNPNWGQSGSLAATAAGSATVMKLNLVAPNTYQGVNVSSTGGPGDPGVINVTGKATLHVSYWTPNGTNFTFTPIDAGDNEFPIASGTLTQNAWTDLDFPITNGGFDLKTVRQLKFVSSAAEIIYLDNIYFH